MIDKFDRLYKQLEELIPDLTELKPGDGRTSKSAGFMDLHLDILTKDAEEMMITLSHNYRQGGDTIADPDMQIRVHLNPDWKKAEALTFQQGDIYHVVYPEPGKVYPRLKRMLNGFLKVWLINLKRQGHKLNPDIYPTI